VAQYLEWVRSHSQTLFQRSGRHIGVFINEVIDPPFLGIGVLPRRYADFLDRAIECLNGWPVPEGRVAEVHPRMVGVLEEARNRIRTQVVNAGIASLFIQWVRGLDQRRNIDCRATFPEYQDLLAGYEK